MCCVSSFLLKGLVDGEVFFRVMLCRMYSIEHSLLQTEEEKVYNGTQDILFSEENEDQIKEY